MKNTLFLALVAFATSSLADVTLYSKTNCGTGGTTASVATVANTCYALSDTTEWHSVQGCSSGHWLRIHTTTDCSDNQDSNGGQVSWGDCASLDSGAALGSFKCVTI